MEKGRILVVDDDAFFRVMINDILKNEGYDVLSASSGEDAIKILDVENVDIVVTDLFMHEIDGIELLHKAKQINALVDVILVTGHGSIESAVKALKLGAFDYIRKPFDAEELAHTVKACYEKKKLLEENNEMRQSLKLFEVAKVITSTIDLRKLYDISLDAVLQIAPVTGGFSAFYGVNNTNLDVKSHRHIDYNFSAEAALYFSTAYASEFKSWTAPFVLTAKTLKSPVPQTVSKHISYIVVPLLVEKAVRGFMIIVDDRPVGSVTPALLSNAAFIADQASTAFENALRYEQAQELAYIDSLTGLYNAKFLDKTLDKEMKRAERLLAPMTLLFLDVDNFKQINDKNDHLAGSKVLIEVAKILLKSVREIDAVVRYGGDEFVVILVDAEYEAAHGVAERIRSSVERKIFLEEEGLDIRLTVSIGLATYPLHTKDKKMLLKAADKAMYRAKYESKNAIYVATMPDNI